MKVSSLIQPLKRDAGRHRTVTDDGYDLVVLSLKITRLTKAHRGRDRRAAVTDVENVVFAFLALWEAAQAARLSQRVEVLGATGQQLVRVSLMANVPDQLVPRRVENVVKRDREFDHTKI